MKTQSSPGPEFLRGAGEMAALTRAFDWSATPLGSPETWPQSLRTAVGIVLQSPVPMVLLWGRDGIMIYNDGYARIAGARHPGILGCRVLDAWPEAADWNAEVLRTVLGGGTLSIKDQEFTLLRNGQPEQVWLTLDYGPVIDESGQPGGVLAVCVETTERVLAERRTAAEHERLRTMFAQAPGFMAMLSGPEHRFEIVNASYMQLVGHRQDLIGKTVREALPDIEGQGYFELLDEVYRTARPFTGRNLAVDLQRKPGMPVEKRFVDLVYQPIVDDAGQATGIFAEGFDVTERALAEERQALLLREMNHRVKNLFAIVLGMIGSTARRASTPAEMADALRGRLQALAAAHDLIRPAMAIDGGGEARADLGALLRAVVGPMLDSPSRLRMSGPDVALGEQAATALALLLHETATNAVKYGSLAVADGSVQVDWSADADKLELNWSEQGGPPPREPSVLGFGSLLVQRSVEGQLQGTLTRQWRPEGLLKQVSIPLDALAT
jgi:PAS domain S-box-containing protein